MSETSTTHHKIKAEWTKASENEIYQNSSESERIKLEIDEDESEIREEKVQSSAEGKIKILEQIVIYPIQNSMKCHFCDKNFDKSVLKDHQKVHEKTFFNCSECDKRFKRKSSLRKHLNFLHKKKFKYECKECQVTFIDLTKFDQHTNTKHKTKETQRKYHCQDINCNKSFASPEYLKRHQVTHDDDFKYKCSSCDQKFKWLTGWKIHQTIHTQNKTLVECSVCYKRFFNQRTLERHRKIHKNVKYKCKLCEKVVSNRKDNIRRHIRHLHADVERTDISNQIGTIQNYIEIPAEEDDLESTNVQIGGDEQNDLTETSEFSHQTPKMPSPPPIIDNRVKVIQSIGNPNKHQLPATQHLTENSQGNEAENRLPPKKKAIALSQPSASSAPMVKPKYDPIQHYRKILLGFSKDDDHSPSNDEIIVEEGIDQEDQVFPVHWRKRTSQNFLFRR